ncbi:MAG TPA: hypothetical protein PKI02_09525 [Mycobacterium sp.]|nr:hypothetical protein [Mycobacterium sp.]HNM93450.1 hypothetical protein [Mycobacterium sp.]
MEAGVWAFTRAVILHPYRGIDEWETIMIILGVILLLIGYFTGLSLLYTIGGILVVVGVVLWLLGAVGRPVAGRKAWY